MGLSIRVKHVEPLDDMTLTVTFENGVVKQYDTKQLLTQFSCYEKLKEVSFFKMVHVECGGCAVAWDDEVDISEVELWEGGITLNPFNDADNLEGIV